MPTQIPQIHKGIGTRLFILHMNTMDSNMCVYVLYSIVSYDNILEAGTAPHNIPLFCYADDTLLVSVGTFTKCLSF